MKRSSITDEESQIPLALSDKDSTSIASTAQQNRTLKVLFCFAGLQISYVLWGIVQEQIMTKTYKGGKFRSSAVI